MFAFWRKVYAKKIQDSVPRVGLQKDDDMVATLIKSFHGFLHLTQVLLRVKGGETLPRSRYEESVILTPKATRQERKMTGQFDLLAQKQKS